MRLVRRDELRRLARLLALHGFEFDEGYGWRSGLEGDELDFLIEEVGKLSAPGAKECA